MIVADELELTLFDPAKKQVVALLEREPPLARRFMTASEERRSRAEKVYELEERVLIDLDVK